MAVAMVVVVTICRSLRQHICVLEFSRESAFSSFRQAVAAGGAGGQCEAELAAGPHQ